jgi:hypothetical protein
MNATTNYAAPKVFPPRSGMRRIIMPWEFRHLRGCARVHIAAGIVLTGFGLVTLFGGSFTTKAVAWAVPFLAVAAAQFLFAAWEQAIARSAPAQT